jgi:hypothetical protein
VDGLLGVGVAGGGSSKSANEGAMLAARLTEMRRERDQRAKLQKKEPVMATAPAKASQSEAAAEVIRDAEFARSPGKAKSKIKKKKKKGKK